MIHRLFEPPEKPVVKGGKGGHIKIFILEVQRGTDLIEKAQIYVACLELASFILVSEEHHHGSSSRSCRFLLHHTNVRSGLFWAIFLPFPSHALNHKVFSSKAFTIWVAANVLSRSCFGFTFSRKHICCFAWHHISPPAWRQNRVLLLSIFTSNKPSVCLPCLLHHNTPPTLM